MMSSVKQSLVEDIKLTLGDGMIDIELDPVHYERAIQFALDRYRQRSSNAIEESFIFLRLVPDQSVYFLPSEVQEVRQILRRGVGGMGTGTSIDPFNLAFTNNLYMIQSGGGAMGGGGTGFLATYELAMQYQEMAGTMFGREIMFTWERVSKKLTLHRKFTAQEEVLLWAYNDRPDDSIIQDRMAKPWIRDYATARAKMMIGEAREKFSQIAGPQGGASLNGSALKGEAKEEMARLEEELKNLLDQQQGYGFSIG